MVIYSPYFQQAIDNLDGGRERDPVGVGMAHYRDVGDERM